MLKDKNKVDIDMPIDKLSVGQKKMSLLDLSKLCIFKRYYLATKTKRIVFPEVVKFQTAIFDPKVLLKIPSVGQSFIFKLTASKELHVVGAACDKVSRRTKIWYMDKYKCWVSAGEDNILRQWNTKSQPIQLSIYYIENNKDLIRDPNSALMMYEVSHPDTIMDVIEIYSPHLVATACMDHKIRLISFKEQSVVAVYHEHKTGVRRLSYCHLYNSSIASVGHENYINIWSPEMSLYKAHLGKLEGHNSTVIDAQFSDQTPFLISLDLKENVRVWDIRTMDCLQIITRNSTSSSSPEGLLLFPYHRHKFCIFG